MIFESGTPAIQRSIARTAGILYALIIVAALFAELGVRSTLIISGDAAATARNIVASEGLYRLGLGADVLTIACDIAVAVLLSSLLGSAAPRLAATAAMFRIVAAAVTAAASVLALAPLVLLKDLPPLAALRVPELEALALAALSLRQMAYGTSLLLFGVHCVLLGTLILRSGRIPGLIGWGMGIAGVCYLVNSLGMVLVPTRTAALFPFILIPCFLAEVALTLWLIIRGARATAG